MHTFFDPRWLTAGLASAVQLALFLRWLYRHIRNEEITRAFVEDMATNHLPHIYELLERICEKQGIDRHKPTPHIRWMELNRRPR